MRLVIQGPALGPRQLQQLVGLCGSNQFTQLEPHAYSLRAEFPRQAEIKAYCAEHGMDCAFVPDEQTLQSFGLVVMDMDSTLISIECIDEVADMQGLKTQVAAITESAMRGEIEFAESLRRRVALLQGLDESALQRVYDERLRLQREFMQTVQRLIAQHATQAQAEQALRAQFQEVFVPSNPAQRARLAGWIEAGCQLSASTHNRTHAEHREHVSKKLKNWESDLRELAGQT